MSNVQDVLQSFLLFDEKGEMPKSARVLAFGAQTTNAALLWTRPDLVGAKQAPANCAALRQGDKFWLLPNMRSGNMAREAKYGKTIVA